MDLKVLCLGIVLAVSSFGSSLGGWAQEKQPVFGYTCYGRLSAGVPNAERLGWKVGIQTYSFNKFTFFEAVDMTAALGLKYIEATSWMRLAPGRNDRICADMSDEAKELLRRKLSERRVECVSYYQRIDGKKNPEEAERVIRFCKEMGWMLVTDPHRVPEGDGSMDFYEDLCKKYGVKLVLTNHPKAHKSPYWNPDDVLEDCAGRSSWIGASVDFGHFMRDGNVPLSIVNRYIADGRMFHFHFRDVDALGSKGRDVAVGSGKGQIREVMKSLYDNGVKPLVMLEYERDFYNQMLYLIPSLDYINKVCGEFLEGMGKEENAVKLPAREAKVNGKMQIKDQPQPSGAVHFWDGVSDSIVWKARVPQAGRYRVSISYSLDALSRGGMMSLMVGNRQLLAPALPTANWWDFRTADMGVVDVRQAGEVAVCLQAVQLPDANGAMPDVAWVSFTPTTLPSTDEQVYNPGKDKLEKLFDGKSFEGWEGDKEWFRVEKKCIVGGSLEKDIPQNRFLCTVREYGDFELRLKFMMKNPDAANGGVQFRSQRIPGHYEMKGYQADIISWKWGAMYDESRRNKFLGTDLNVEEVKKNVRADGWNDLVLRCEGKRIRIWINGILSMDYTEQTPGIPQTGFIALQIHQGKPSEVWYKDIEIENLTNK